MPKITESAIETLAIELFKKLGYQYLYAPSIAPDTRLIINPEKCHNFSGSTEAF